MVLAVASMVTICLFSHICLMVQRIFGPKTEEVTGELRKLHNEELNDLYSSPNIVYNNNIFHRSFF